MILEKMSIYKLRFEFIIKMDLLIFWKYWNGKNEVHVIQIQYKLMIKICWILKLLVEIIEEKITLNASKFVKIMNALNDFDRCIWVFFESKF